MEERDAGREGCRPEAESGRAPQEAALRVGRRWIRGGGLEQGWHPGPSWAPAGKTGNVNNADPLGMSVPSIFVQAVVISSQQCFAF